MNQWHEPMPLLITTITRDELVCRTCPLKWKLSFYWAGIGDSEMSGRHSVHGQRHSPFSDCHRFSKSIEAGKQDTDKWILSHSIHLPSLGLGVIFSARRLPPPRSGRLRNCLPFMPAPGSGLRLGGGSLFCLAPPPLLQRAMEGLLLAKGWG